MAQRTLYDYIRTLLLFCGYLAQIFFIGWAGFTWFLMGTRPKYADFEHELVHPITNKGRTVFISNSDKYTLSFLLWGAIAFVGVIFIAWFLDRRNKGRGHDEALLIVKNDKISRLEYSLRALVLIEMFGILFLLAMF